MIFPSGAYFGEDIPCGQEVVDLLKEMRYIKVSVEKESISNIFHRISLTKLGVEECVKMLPIDMELENKLHRKYYNDTNLFTAHNFTSFSVGGGKHGFTLRQCDTTDGRVQIMPIHDEFRDNTCVTGDYGNWVFCRGFLPHAEGYVSRGYMDDKVDMGDSTRLDIISKYDSEATSKAIMERIKEMLGERNLSHDADKKLLAHKLLSTEDMDTFTYVINVDYFFLDGDYFFWWCRKS